MDTRLFFSDSQNQDQKARVIESISNPPSTVPVSSLSSTSHLLRTVKDKRNKNQKDEIIETKERKTEAKISDVQESGAIPLTIHQAAGRGNLDALKKFLDEGVNIDAKDARGLTALHLATSYKHWDCVALLLNRDADITIIDSNGCAFFAYLVMATPSLAEFKQSLSLLLLKKSSAYIKQLSQAKDKANRTLLHYVAEKGHVELIPWIVEQGIDVNAEDNMSYTPLHLAARNGHVPFVKALVERGASSFVININGDTAIHQAEYARQMDVLAYMDTACRFSLIEEQKSTDVSSDQEKVKALFQTALEARRGYFDVDAKKAFYQALDQKHEETIQTLVEIKADKTFLPLSPENKERQFRFHQLDEKAHSSINQLISLLSPENPLIGYALLFKSDLYLIEAGHYVRQYQQKVKEGVEYYDAFRMVMAHYGIAMQCAIAAEIHAAKMVRIALQSSEFNHQCAAQVKRIFIHYRQHVMGKRSALGALRYKAQRETITLHRAALAKTLKDDKEEKQSIKELAKEHSAFFKNLTVELWSDALAQMEDKPPCEYALMIMGSLASDEMAPFSDLEFAIIHARDTNHTNPIYHQHEKRYFLMVAGLMELLTVALGETPLSEEQNPLRFQNGISLELLPTGFHFDHGGGSNPVKRPDIFLGTANQLLAIQKQAVPHDVHRIMVLTTSFLTGQKALHEAYVSGLQTYLNEDLEKSWYKPKYLRAQDHALALIQGDIQAFGPTARNESRVQRWGERPLSFNVKVDLYRLITRTLSNLTLYHQLSVHNNFERIIALTNLGVLSRPVAHTLDSILLKVLRFRFMVQSYYETEQEDLYHSGFLPPLEHPYEKSGYVLKEEELEQLLTIYQTLQALEAALQTFAQSQGKSDAFKTLSLKDTRHLRLDEKAEGHHLKAEAYERLHHPEKAKHWYQRALSLDPKNEFILADYLRFLQTQVTEKANSVSGGERQVQLWIKRFIKTLEVLKLPSTEYLARYTCIPIHRTTWRKGFYQAIKEEVGEEKRGEILALLPNPLAEEISSLKSHDSKSEVKREVKGEAPATTKTSHAFDWQSEWKAHPISAIVNGEMALQEEAKQYPQPANREEEALQKAKLREKRLALYQKTLWTARLSPVEEARLILKGLQLFDEVQKDRDKALKQEDRMLEDLLSRLLDSFLSDERSIRDYVKVYEKLPYALRERFRFVLQARLEKLERSKEAMGGETKASAAGNSSLDAIQRRRSFLENLLKELVRIPDESGQQSEWSLRKTRWEATLKGLIAPSTQAILKPNDSPETKPETKEAQLQNVPLPISVASSFIPLHLQDEKGGAKLNPEIQSALFDEKLSFRDEKISGSQHRVIPVTVHLADGNQRKIYCKANPEMPGMSYFIERLHHQLMGHGTCLSKVVRIDIPGKPSIPVLLSEAVEGETLEAVLKKEPARLKHLSHRHFSEQALVAMLTNPEDGLPSNYIVQLVEIDGAYRLILTSIDHDHALFPAFLEEKQEKKEESGASLPKLQVKTILFCFDAMHHPVDPQARVAFCKLDAGQVLRAVLRDAQEENRYFAKTFDQDTIQAFHNKKIASESCTIPIPLKAGDMVTIYQKMQKLQRFLREHKDVTLLQCLLQVEPRVGLAYEHVLREEANPSKRLERVGNYIPTKDGRLITSSRAKQTLLLKSNLGQLNYAALKDLSPEQSLVELDLMVYQSTQIKSIQDDLYAGNLSRFQALKAPEHQALVISGDKEEGIPPLDWKKLAPAPVSNNKTTILAEQKAQEIILQAMQGIPFTYLPLAHCYALSLQQLGVFLQASPDLIELDLSYHPSIHRLDLFAQNNHPTLQTLILKGMPELQAVQNLSLPALKTLIITDAPKLRVVKINAPQLTLLHLTPCPVLQEIETQSTKLEEVNLSSASQLSWGGLKSMTNDAYVLKVLQLRDCHQINASRLFSDYPFLMALVSYPINASLLNELKHMLDEKFYKEKAGVVTTRMRKKIVGYLLFTQTGQVLIEDLKSRKPGILEMILSALVEIVKIKPELGAVTLKVLQPLLVDNYVDIQKKACTAFIRIAQMKAELGKISLKLLEISLNDNDQYGVEKALSVLVRIVKAKPELSETAFEILQDLLKKRAWGIQGIVSLALVEIAKVKPNFGEAVFNLLKPLLKSTDRSVLIDVFPALVEIVNVKPELRERALEALQPLLKLNRDTDISHKASSVFGQITRVTPKFDKIPFAERQLLLNDNRLDTPNKAQPVFSEVAEVKPEFKEVSSQLLYPLLKDKEKMDTVLEKTCLTLVEIAATKPELRDADFMALQSLLKDEKENVRRKASLTFVELVKVKPGYIEAIFKLLESLLKSNEKDARERVFSGLIGLVKVKAEFSERALKILQPWLKDKDTDIRKKAFSAFSEILSDKLELFECVLKYLSPLLNNKNPAIQQDAITTYLTIVYTLNISSPPDLSTFINHLLGSSKESSHPAILLSLSNQSQQQSLPQNTSSNSKEISIFYVEENKDIQSGWNCFDMAAGLSRKRLVNFALEHKQDARYRKMLAPEIRTSAAITAILMNMQDEKEIEAKKQAEELAELFHLHEIARQFGDQDDERMVAANIYSLLSKQKTSSNEHGLAQLALPKSMRTQEVQTLINNYNKAHEDIKPYLAQCNTLLGHPEGKRLSYDALCVFFANPHNHRQHEAAWRAFDKALDLFIPAETALNNYCEREDIYEAYVRDYYGKNQWVAFQPASSGKKNSSIIDIIARCLNKQIIIYQMNNNIREEIYRTEFKGEGAIHVQYNGHNHFVALKINPNYFKVVEAELIASFSFFKPQNTSVSVQQQPDVKDDVNQNKIVKLITGYLA